MILETTMPALTQRGEDIARGILIKKYVLIAAVILLWLVLIRMLHKWVKAVIHYRKSKAH